MSDQTLDTCNCCEGVEPLTPASLENQPGLSALAYRVGTHGQFKATMQAALAGRIALHDLTTREDDDPSIALIDAWATVLDVLSFYQERIAGEGFLRTATERRSVLELARAIGYELNPGVAASTYLAFTLEGGPGAPEQVTINTGTKAQSLPGPGELPQTFETIEAIDARPEWNQLKVKTTLPSIPDSGATQVYVAGINTQLKPGDGLLIIGRVYTSDPNSERWDFRRITKVTADTNANTTLIEWATGLSWARAFERASPAQQDIRVYAFRQRAALFGTNAPDWRAMPKESRLRYQGKLPTEADTNTDPEWPNFSIAVTTEILNPDVTTGIGLYGEYFDNRDLTNLVFTRIDTAIDFNWASGSPGTGVGSDTFSVRWTGQVQPEFSETYTFYTQSDDGVRLWINGQLIIDNWTNHPSTENTGQITLQANKKCDVRLDYYENGGSALIKLSWSSPSRSKQVVPKSRLYPSPVIFLDALYASILPESWLALSASGYQEIYQVIAAAEAARNNYALTAKSSRLELAGANLYARFNNKLRETVILAHNEQLNIAEAPDTSPVAQGSDNLTLVNAVAGLEKGHRLVVSGLDAATHEPRAEVVLLKSVDQNGTQLVFQSKLTQSYRRDTVSVYANVALATHGETKTQVLGSGDAAQPLQSFLLKEGPLTYVASAAPSGADSTLKVNVNDIQWRATPSLFGLGLRDRAYAVRHADDGKTTVQFGDGAAGARPPTGVENIVATYRVGIGLGGLVKAGQISLLLTRPLGLKSVINPLAADGAADPEQLDDARTNAPFTVLTLDRIVSLQDFEDFARAFAGIGKAQATWLWDGEKRLVHLTIGAANGNTISESSQLFVNVRNAIDAARDTIQHVVVQSYQPLTFNVEAKALVATGYDKEKVKAAALAALQGTFAFASRQFGQGVTQSEVLTAVQAVAGVQAVDLDRLYLTGQTATLKERLTADIAHWDASVTPAVIKPAELLTINSTGIQLTDMTVA